jgi:lipopolysaccharide exporter
MSISKRIVSGGAWSVGVRMLNKSLNALQLLILSRVLFPGEFGVFAIASLTLIGFDVLTRTGFDDALIYKRGDIREYLDTAFVIQVLRGIVLAGLVFVFAPFIVSFFEEPGAAGVVRALALVQVIKGFRSLGVVLWQRDINFRAEALFLTAGNIVTVVTTVILALILRDVWSLVYGAIAGELCLTLLSYFVHSYRPRLNFSVEKAKELVHFGVWLFLSGAVSYVSLQADNIAVGKLLSADVLGIYYMGFRIANLFVEELSKPIGRVLQPAYANLQDKPERLRIGLERTLAVYLMVLLPLAIFLMGSAWLTIPVLLGAKWHGVIEIFPILVLGALFRGVAGVSRAFLVGTGRPRGIFWLEAARAGSLAVSLYPLFLCCGLNGIAWAATLSSAIKFGLLVLLLIPQIEIRVLVFRELVPVTLASLVLGVVLMGSTLLVSVGWWSFWGVGISSALAYSVSLWLASRENSYIEDVLRLVKELLERFFRFAQGRFVGGLRG